MTVNTFVVLPAYNEELALPRVLTKLARMYAQGKLQGVVLVVDDGSEDRTARIAREWGEPVRCVSHAQNMGLGAALRTGLSHAADVAHDDDIIVTMDADDTHDPALILRMVHELGQEYDVVIASRFCENSSTSGVSAARQFMSWMAGQLFRLLLPMQGVRDYTSGFRAYRAGTLKRVIVRWGELFIDRDDFSSMPRLLLRFRRLEARATEVPMVLRYDLKPTATKMHVGSNITANLRLILQELHDRDR